MRRVLQLLVLLPLFFSLAACGEASRFDAGAPLTAQELAALQAQLGERENERGNEQQNEETPPNGIVFWLPSGSVYHISATCHHINGKPNTLSGTVEQAQAAGKLRACSSCG